MFFSECVEKAPNPDSVMRIFRVVQKKEPEIRNENYGKRQKQSQTIRQQFRKSRWDKLLSITKRDE